MNALISPWGFIKLYLPIYVYENLLPRHMTGIAIHAYLIGNLIKART